MEKLLKDPKVLIGAVVGLIIMFVVFLGGGDSEQSATFNGSNNVQSSDNSRTVNVNQNATQSQNNSTQGSPVSE